MDKKEINGLIIGNRYTLDEIVEALPDMWVAMKDCELDDIHIANGILIDVTDNDSKYDMINNYAGSEYDVVITYNYNSFFYA